MLKGPRATSLPPGHPDQQDDATDAELRARLRVAVAGQPKPATGPGFNSFDDYAAALDLQKSGKADQATLNRIKNTPQTVIDSANTPG